MKYNLSKYELDDFLEIRDFLINNFENSSKNNNWTIERWNFCRYVAQIFHKSFNDWPNSVGIWKDKNDEIVAVANSQGEILDRNTGECFFQLKKGTSSSTLFSNMIDFAEQYLSIYSGNLHRLNCFINNHNYPLQKELKQRGYVKSNIKDYISSINICDVIPIALDPQFRLVNATQFSITQKAEAHGKAFGYQEEEMDTDLDALVAFSCLSFAPDYNPYLDLAILNNNNQIVSFACFWYDEQNCIGILEPLGTLPEYRKMGFAKILIHQGMNLIQQLGGTRLNVGSNSPFYKSIGFKEFSHNEIWYKEWS